MTKIPEYSRSFARQIGGKLYDILDNAYDAAENAKKLGNGNPDKESTLSYKNALLNTDVSHVDEHISSNCSKQKKDAATTAMSRMLNKNKTANGCFLDEKLTYENIVFGMIDEAEQIGKWLCDKDNPDKLVLYVTTKKVERGRDDDEPCPSFGPAFRTDNKGQIKAYEANVMTVVLVKNDPVNGTFGENELGFYVETAYPGISEALTDSQTYNEYAQFMTPDETINPFDICKLTNEYKNADLMKKLYYKMKTDPIKDENGQTIFDKIPDGIEIQLNQSTSRSGLTRNRIQVVTPCKHPTNPKRRAAIVHSIIEDKASKLNSTQLLGPQIKETGLDKFGNTRLNSIDNAPVPKTSAKLDQIIDAIKDDIENNAKIILGKTAPTNKNTRQNTISASFI